MLPLFMKSLIEISVSKEHFQDIVSEYNAEGFEYVSSRPSDDKNMLILLLRGDIHKASQYQSDKSYLEFGDGTQSPLYIKRNRNFWED
jgi:hypothetical protein